VVGSKWRSFFSFGIVPFLIRFDLSTPVGLQFEKFYIPDVIRVLDGMMETLKY
jgi:hypothetical protein